MLISVLITSWLIYGWFVGGKLLNDHPKYLEYLIKNAYEKRGDKIHKAKLTSEQVEAACKVGFKAQCAFLWPLNLYVFSKEPK